VTYEREKTFMDYAVVLLACCLHTVTHIKLCVIELSCMKLFKTLTHVRKVVT